MLEYGYTDYTMYIGEHLGNPERERIRRMNLEEASEEAFEHPNNLLLYADTLHRSMQTPYTGLCRHPAQVYADTRTGLCRHPA